MKAPPIARARGVNIGRSKLANALGIKVRSIIVTIIIECISMTKYLYHIFVSYSTVFLDVFEIVLLLQDERSENSRFTFYVSLSLDNPDEL